MLNLRIVFQIFCLLPCIVYSNQADLLLDKIFAVHATRNLPYVDYLKAGLGGKELNAPCPEVRKTVHFALGELVRPVKELMDWEDCPYALVTSLRNLLPQLLNINCYDTFILGDFRLHPDIYLILPIDMIDKIETIPK